MRKRNLLVFTLALSILIGLGNFSGATDLPGPCPPSWVPADEYTVFEGSIAYSDEYWPTILALREAAANGALLRDAFGDSTILDKSQELYRLTRDDGGIAFELGLLSNKLHCNTGDWKNYSSAQSNFSSALTQAWKKPNVEQLHVLYLWMVRTSFVADDARGTHISYSNGIKNLLTMEGFAYEDIFEAEMFDLLPADLLAEYKDFIFVTLDNFLIYPASSVERLIKPQAKNNTTMVPIRILAELLSYQVDWDGDTQSVTISNGSDRIVVTLGSTIATKNGAEIELTAAPYAYNGTTYLPLAFISRELGEKVTWDQEKRLVSIGSGFDTPELHNLARWALPMGSMLNYINSTDPAIFGAPRFIIDGSRPIPFSYKNRAINVLSSSYGIRNREALINTVQRMTANGHNSEFLRMAEYTKALSEVEYASMIKFANATDRFMFPQTLALSEKWGDRGIKCWDLFRMSNLVQWGYTAEYLEYEEALALLEPAVILLQENFSSWDEAYENYLDGYYWWARENVQDGDVWKTERGQFYLDMKGRSTMNWIFNDDLFTTPIVSVSGFGSDIS